MSPEQIDQIVALIASGKSQRLACEEVGVNEATFRKAASRNDEVAEKVRDAREQSAESFADKTVETIEREDLTPHDKSVRLQGYRWLASVRDRAKFGEKQDIKVEHTVRVDFDAALVAARSRFARLAQNSHTAEIVDAQVIEAPRLIGASAADKQSDAPATGSKTSAGLLD